MPYLKKNKNCVKVMAENKSCWDGNLDDKRRCEEDETTNAPARGIPLCVGMHRHHLLSNRVGHDLSLVEQGGSLSHSAVDFANEWWGFRYNLQTMKIIGPLLHKGMQHMMKTRTMHPLLSNLQKYSAFIIDVNPSLLDESQDGRISQWSLLLYVPRLSMFYHFDTDPKLPNREIAQQTASKFIAFLQSFDFAGFSNGLYHHHHSFQTLGETNHRIINVPTPQHGEPHIDSSIHTVGITACLAKYHGDCLTTTTGNDAVELGGQLGELISQNITTQYLQYLRCFLKRLHSKLAIKLYESAARRRSLKSRGGDDEDDVSPSQKRRLDGALANGNLSYLFEGLDIGPPEKRVKPTCDPPLSF